MEICHRYEKRGALYRTGTKPAWFIWTEDSTLHCISLPGVPWSQQHLLGVSDVNCCSADCRALLQAEPNLCAPCSAGAWHVKGGISEQTVLALTQGMMAAPLETFPQQCPVNPAAGQGSASPSAVSCHLLAMDDKLSLWVKTSWEKGKRLLGHGRGCLVP